MAESNLKRGGKVHYVTLNDEQQAKLFKKFDVKKIKALKEKILE